MNTDPYYVGIDPDLQRPALAIVQGQDVVYVACMRTGKSRRQQAVSDVAKLSYSWMKGIDLDSIHPRCPARIVVEAQQIYAGKTKNPQDICLLAAAAGASLASSLQVWPNAEPEFVLPRDWKKGVPKRIHQARVLSRLGIVPSPQGDKSTGYCVPVWHGEAPRGAKELKKTDWKHVVDAIGLACYARDKK